MRNIMSTLFLVVFISISLKAQVNEGMVLMSMGTHPAYSVVLEGADMKKSEKIWKDYMKPYGKFDKDRKRKELRAADLNISSIATDRTFSVTVKLEEQRDQTTVHVFFQSAGKYLDSNSAPEISANLEQFVNRYAYEVQRAVLSEQLKNEEKQLSRLHKDLSKLENKNRGYHDDIQKFEKKIKEAEENIEQNIRDQDEKNYEIVKQQKLIEKMAEKLNNIGKN